MPASPCLADRPAVWPLPEAVALSHRGGNLAVARLRFPDPPQPWIDLSTGLDPEAYPARDLPSAIRRRLPDVVAAPGTQAPIQILPRVFPARRVAILGFGYQEHPASWHTAGVGVVVRPYSAEPTRPRFGLAADETACARRGAVLRR